MFDMAASGERREKRPNMTEHQHSDDKAKPVTVVVNEKNVALQDRDTTGEQIKRAAIDQGVAIRLDFNLFLVEGNKQRPIGDKDPIKVHENDRFRAVAPDDNSWR